MTQARDDVVDADLLDELSAALDDVTAHVTMTSRRLSDVTGRAQNVSTSVEQQFSGDWLVDIINAVSNIIQCSKCQIASWRSSVAKYFLPKLSLRSCWPGCSGMMIE